MRDARDDRGQFWTPAPDWGTAILESPGWRARRVGGLVQTLVSGDLDAARDMLAPGGGEVGLWGIAGDGAAVVRIGRDRALVVSGSPPVVAAGWHGGFAASPCDDLYAVLEIAGAGLAEVIAEGTSADLAAGSRSAAVLFAGVPCLLYRTGEQAARLHVESPFAAYIWTWLQGCVAPPAANRAPGNEGASE